MLDVEKLTDVLVAQTMKAIDAATRPLLDRIALLEKEVAGLPSPAAGRDGADGRDGTDGKSVTVEDVAPIIEAKIAEVVAALPQAKDGTDGRDGTDGKDGVNGVDGAGIADLLIDRAGALVATMTDGRVKNLGAVIGRDGKDGRDGSDGKDGLDGADGKSVEDFTVDVSGTRPVLRCAVGDVVKLVPIPGFVDRGVYKGGEAYVRGDGVTFGGSFWICQADTGAKPGEGDDWRLAVKKGRDGRDGVVKTAPEPKPVQVGG